MLGELPWPPPDWSTEKFFEFREALVQNPNLIDQWLEEYV
jgi:hypothetical protein